ncbi:MAG TPA: S49 family peptidase [Phycisphaerae bacterium]|nr:S49 family peptidase [Phycisphaerae bacterium]
MKTNKTTETPASIEAGSEAGSEARPNTGRDRALLDCLLQTTWAMEPRTLERLSEVLLRHRDGIRLSAEQIERIAAAGKKTPATKRTYQLDGATAVIAIHGVIEKHATAVADISLGAGTSVDEISAQLHQANADEKVRDILLHIESPGGSVAGIADLADEIYAANAVKPVTAFADDQADSAAYFLGSQASRFYANQSAEVGAIGVYAVLLDSSRAAENAGLKVHVVKAGEFKGAGVRGTHITEDQLAAYQDEIDAHYEMFVAAVARGRGIAIEAARTLGDGRVHIGLRAVEAGLIDGVKTYRQALTSAKPTARAGGAKGAKAEGAQTESGSTENSPPSGGSTDTRENQPKRKEHNEMSDQEKEIDAAVEKAKQAERERMAGIEAALGGVEGLEAVRERALTSDMTVEAAKAEAYDALLKATAKQLARRDEEIQTLADENEKLTRVLGAKGVKASELAGYEASDQQRAEADADGTGGGSDDGKAATYDARVKALRAEGKTKGEAYMAAARELPKSHEVWIKTQ